MDFAPSPEHAALEERIRTFLRGSVLPFESDPRRTPHGPAPELRAELVAHAAAAGLLTPQAPRPPDHPGLTHLGQAIAFEAAGHSLLGPVALNCAAPDEGNMHLLGRIGTAAQQAQFLAPMIRGETRSCFCMTEPAPGAGADPAALATTAEKRGDRFVITGRKWLITGAEGAAFAIVMARTLDNGRDLGATMFLAALPAPGFRILRRIDTIDSSFSGGHAEIALEGLEIPAENVLGEVGEGFRHAQIRLVPARLTHCMRWLGAAQRAHDTACAYATGREVFGRPVAAHGAAGVQLADNEIDLHVTRLAIRHAAWVLDQGGRGGRESSMVKVQASEAIFRIVDRAMQVMGGTGVSDDTEVARIFRDVRAFRIYDGPSEVHRWALARRILRRHGADAAEG